MVLSRLRVSSRAKRIRGIARVAYSESIHAWRDVGRDHGSGNQSEPPLEMQMKMSIQQWVIFSAVVVALLSAAQLRAADSEVSGVFKGNACQSGNKRPSASPGKCS